MEQTALLRPEAVRGYERTSGVSQEATGVVFGRTWVRPRRKRKERQLAGSTGRKSFLPNVMTPLMRKYRVVNKNQ